MFLVNLHYLPETFIGQERGHKPTGSHKNFFPSSSLARHSRADRDTSGDEHSNLVPNCARLTHNGCFDVGSTSGMARSHFGILLENLCFLGRILSLYPKSILISQCESRTHRTMVMKRAFMSFFLSLTRSRCCCHIRMSFDHSH